MTQTRLWITEADAKEYVITEMLITTGRPGEVPIVCMTLRGPGGRLEIHSGPLHLKPRMAYRFDPRLASAFEEMPLDPPGGQP